jgi:ferredoxin
MTCTKRSFCNKHEAKAMLRSAKERNVEHRAECRIYRCDSCRCWHLTSMTIEEYEAQQASEDFMNPN